ncbi:MAG: NTP transferase domain-containing protein [Chloroflexi bacterium]|nr:NTP transferase domain-containing protein [Chloroflexota bacterium]
MPSTNEILGLILGGGRGARLYPLTKLRAKPAVPIAGKYRLIDIPISNCINAGIHKIAVLTQFKSVSLHRHIAQAYAFDAFNRGWVQILAAEQRSGDPEWYQGTADAVRKQLLEIRAADTAYTLVLAGDHLYRMDYDELAAYHWENNAEITVAVQPVLRSEAARFGLLKTEADGRISEFAEKPQDPAVLERFVSRDDEARPFLGSMGIYLFNTEVLVDLLESTTDTDFGGEVIPHAINTRRVFGYHFEGYWEDIGTIRSFYDTNLRLTRPDTPFKFNDPEDPIYTRARFLPGSIVAGAMLENVLMADGCTIGRAEIHDSVVGLRSCIADGARITRSIIMGADYYDNPEARAQGEGIPLGIGENCQIEGAIIDKNVRAGGGVVIRAFPLGTELDAGDWAVQDGIVVVAKGTVLQPGAYIGP